MSKSSIDLKIKTIDNTSFFETSCNVDSFHQIVMGDIEVIVSTGVAKKIVWLQEVLEREWKEINMISPLKPTGRKDFQHFLVKATKKLRAEPSTMKISLLQVLENMQATDNLAINKAIADLALNKQATIKTAEYRKENLDRFYAQIQASYTLWRKKKDFKAFQQTKFAEFVEVLDENPIFKYYHILETCAEAFMELEDYLKQLSVTLKTKLSKVKIELQDDDQSVGAFQTALLQSRD